MSVQTPYYNFCKAPSELAAHVDCIYQFKDDSKCLLPKVHYSIPDGYPELIINLGGPYLREDLLTRKAEKISSNSCVFIGIKGRSVRITQEGACNIIGIKFKAHGLSLLTQIDQRDTLNRIFMGHEFFGKEIDYLIDTLKRCSVSERIEVLTQYLGNKVKGREICSPLLDVVYEINRLKGVVQIRSLCDQFRMIPRTLENHFRQYIGLSPKEYSKIIQFNHFQIQSYERKNSFSEVALECGYYDQSHLNRTFREYIYTTPGKHFGSINFLNRINLDILQKQLNFS